MSVSWTNVAVRLAWGAIAIAGWSSLEVRAQESTHDLIVFASVEGSSFSEVASGSIDGHEVTPSVDVIYSRARERFRLFGEYLINDDEHELERFQVGWQLSEGTRLWFGRFHHSGSYWNTAHHHGQFLQTSISRPAIEQFEDFGGVLPAHVSGVLLEQREEFDTGSALHISLSAGLTGQLAHEEIRPFDLLDPESGFASAFNARVAFSPDALGESQVGISIGNHNLRLDESSPPSIWDPDANEIELETVGAYIDWGWKNWRLLGSALEVSARAAGGMDGSARRFTASYLQGEYTVRPDWIVYGRVEDVTGDTSYLELFPTFVSRQSVIGARWLVAAKHAVTFEGGSATAIADHYHRFSIQWSAVFP